MLHAAVAARQAFPAAGSVIGTPDPFDGRW
jgi:hypothetical protein